MANLAQGIVKNSQGQNLEASTAQERQEQIRPMLDSVQANAVNGSSTPANNTPGYRATTPEKISAQQWMERLQSTCNASEPSCRLEARNYWTRQSVQSEIIVFQNKTKRYTLRPSNDLLQHDDDDGSPGHSLFTLLWNPTSDPNATDLFEPVDEPDDFGHERITIPVTAETQVFSMTTEATPSAHPCIFVALGWLVEEEVGQGAMRTTNWVVILNLSTDPASVWLVFDYHMEDFAEEQFRWTNQLGNYHNERFSRRGMEPKFVPKVKDDFEPYKGPLQDNYTGFRHRYTNLGPSNRDAQSSEGSRAHLFSCPRQPNGLPPFRYSVPAAQDSGQPSINTVQDSSDNAPMPPSTSTVPSDAKAQKQLPNPAQGFFGLPPHDLVLLAPDVTAWSATTGLDPAQVHLCLKNTYTRFGSSLHAKIATGEQVERLESDRVRIQHLCFTSGE
ncbi:MAG: hypothetical protein Q9184_006234 [Pyrenodesmia sp. 2 TL-2023]